MKFTELALPGAFILDIEPRVDERGFFARTFCQQEFSAYDIDITIVQCNVSFSRSKGTLRGLHFQKKPFEEVKIIRCTRGAIYDVIVDIRKDSPTFCQWVSVELAENNYRALYVPKGFAHGFQTLVDNTEVHYQVSAFYNPSMERGIRWNDSSLGIQWKMTNNVTISSRDALFPDLAVVLAEL